MRNAANSCLLFGGCSLCKELQVFVAVVCKLAEDGLFGLRVAIGKGQQRRKGSGQGLFVGSSFVRSISCLSRLCFLNSGSGRRRLFIAGGQLLGEQTQVCLLYTSPSPRDA